MDRKLISSMAFGFACLAIAMALQATVGTFSQVLGILIALSASAAMLLVMFPGGKAKDVIAHAPELFKDLPTLREEMDRIIVWGFEIRKKGLAVLERNRTEIGEPMLKSGMEMILQGISSDDMKERLEEESTRIQERQAIGKKMLDQLGTIFPGFCIVGTMISLVAVFFQEEDSSKLGAGMAAAMVTTFYGIFLNNLFIVPLTVKLDSNRSLEPLRREIMIRGLIGINEGESHLVIRTRLEEIIPSPSRLNEAA